MYIYGINPILESLRSNHLPESILIQESKDNKRIQHIIKQADKRQVHVEKVKDLRTYLPNNAVHQGVAGKYDKPFIKPIKELPDEETKLLILDGITDPHNFGAAIRVAEVFGYTNILFHQGDSSGITPVAVKSSSGAIFHCQLYYSNLNQAIRILKDRNFTFYALDVNTDKSIYDLSLDEKHAIVIGSEQKGVRHNIKQNSLLIKIPMSGKLDSLNVSCALSACLSEFHRQSLIK